MAKITNILGSISGRIGGIVYSKGEKPGISYMRSWQPQVLNPKTDLQNDQRAKVNLMGRLTQVTPPEVILGMGRTKRSRRSNFNKNLIDVATIDRSAPGTIVAKVAPEDVIFSKGSQSLQATVSTPATVTATEATIALTLADAALAGMYGERIVVAVIDPDDKAGYSLVKYADVVFDDTAAKTATVKFGAPIAVESLVCLYRVPYLLTEEGAAKRTQSIANDGFDIIAKVLSSSNLVRDWGNSTLANKQVFTQA